MADDDPALSSNSPQTSGSEASPTSEDIKAVDAELLPDDPVLETDKPEETKQHTVSLTKAPKKCSKCGEPMAKIDFRYDKGLTIHDVWFCQRCNIIAD